MVKELWGLADIPVAGSAMAQSYGLAPYVPFTEHSALVPFSLKYGPLYDEESPLLTTNDCFPGIAKYRLKSYVILNVLKSGFGLRVVTRSIPVYTAILLIGLIGSTFHDAFTQSASTPFAVSGDAVLRRANIKPESSSMPESIVSLVVRFIPVHIHIFVPSSYI